MIYCCGSGSTLFPTNPNLSSGLSASRRDSLDAERKEGVTVVPWAAAYPFPGDLRAKFAWKEASRLSRGELIDNTAVTCSRFDRCQPSHRNPQNPHYRSRSTAGDGAGDSGWIPTSECDVPEVRNSLLLRQPYLDRDCYPGAKSW